MLLYTLNLRTAAVKATVTIPIITHARNILAPTQCRDIGAFFNRDTQVGHHAFPNARTNVTT